MARLGTHHNPLFVAIVGSGPSGFYAAEALIKSKTQAKIDIFERLPSPFGLVRSGVAPDHQKLKQVIKLYENIAASEDVNLIANVKIGRDISIDTLNQAYHAIIFAYGAEKDRQLGIPGEHLPGCYTATDFVGWYNGHPEHRQHKFDLSSDIAVIIGQGNVAADVARILSKTVDELKHTDIAEHALEVLAESKIKEIHVIGRRGPAQAKFSLKELRELAHLSDCNPIIAAQDLILNPESETELSEKKHIVNKKVYEQFCAFAKTASSPGKSKNCFFKFLMSPKELIGDDVLEKIVFEKNKLSGVPSKQSVKETGDTLSIDSHILFKSIGYFGVPIDDVPFQDTHGIIPNDMGRVIYQHQIVPGFYTAGWIKRGPSGLIGTNRACSAETVASLLADIKKWDNQPEKTGSDSIYPVLEKQGVRYIDFSDWKKIDVVEIENGKIKEKPREKFTCIDEMLAVID